MPRLSAAPGSSVWTCTLRALESPTTSSESPSRSRSRSRPSASSPAPSITNTVQYRYSDSSWCIASTDSATGFAGASGAGSPATAARTPRMISSNPAPPASTTPASLSTASSSGVRSSDSSPRATIRLRSSTRSSPCTSGDSAASAISRMTVSIVPSTGRRTARYAASLAERNARAIIVSSIGSCSPSTSAKPRTIWLKMTPEFPRAPISAARESSRATASWPSAFDFSSASTIARTVSVRFVPVSPSGTG